MTTAIELLAGLRAQGIHLRVIEGDRLSIRPWSALNTRTREAIHAQKPRLVALLKEVSREPQGCAWPPDRTRTPAPCAACGGGLFWRQSGQVLLRCQLCVPWSAETDAAWYYAADSLDLLGEVLGADTRAALDWYTRRHPETLGKLLGLQRRCERLPQGASEAERREAVSGLVTFAREIRNYFRENGGDA